MPQANIYTPLPLLVFGVLSMISGCLIILLPETVGCELPQTLQESEEFGKWVVAVFSIPKIETLF